MNQIKRKCPHCGNVVVGQIDATLARRATRKAVKKGGAKAIGAAIGTFIAPGAGTAVGAGIGFVADMLLEDQIAGVSDSVESAIFDNADYVFECPNCDYSWKEHLSNQRDTSGVVKIANNALMVSNPVVGYAVKAWMNSNQTEDDNQHSTYKSVSTILQIVSDKLSVNVDDITPNSDLEDDLGADELDKTEIIMEIEKYFGIAIEKEPEDFTFVDDLIEEVTGESLWLDDDFDKNEYNGEIAVDDSEDEGNQEQERFNAFFQSYLDEEYKDMELEELSGMFEREGNACPNDIIKSQYYCVAAIVRLEFFLVEWIDNNFKNYIDPEAQISLQKKCIGKGLEDVKICRDILPEDKEYLVICKFLTMLKEFWIESCLDKNKFITNYGNIENEYGNIDNCIFNMDWLINLFKISYERIFSRCKTTDEIETRSIINENEQEYLEELKEILTEGEISPRERRLLDKIRTKLGISEERAIELEASLSTPTLTEEEQEYMNEYKEIVSEGEISPRDQRYLDKLKKANNISDERAKEIEKMVSL